MTYYDRAGVAIDQRRWGELHDDVLYKLVSRTMLEAEVMVSTVWLGIDHSFTGEGPPIIFETMVFGGEHDEEQWRYATEEAAIIGHLEVLDMLRKEP